MRSHEFIAPIEQGKWELLVSANDKSHWGKDLIDLVQHAYAQTDLGSFVNSLADVNRSDWLVLDWDGCNRPDCAIFFRENRPDENWTGFKIQGIGHNGVSQSKITAMNKLKAQLTKSGWWIESSHAMSSLLSRMNSPTVTDESLLQSLFLDPELKMMDETGKYQRALPSGKVIHERVYGHPIIKRTL